MYILLHLWEQTNLPVLKRNRKENLNISKTWKQNDKQETRQKHWMPVKRFPKPDLSGVTLGGWGGGLQHGMVLRITGIKLPGFEFYLYFSGSVTLGKAVNNSKPQSFHLWSGVANTVDPSTAQGLGMLTLCALKNLHITLRSAFLI